jgi:hypothetical protein
VAFLGEVVEKTPAGKEIHVVLDNLSAHKTQTVRDFSNRTRVYGSTSRIPIRLGSIRWSCGLPKSSAM